MPGFAAAAKYTQGYLEDDAALRAEGLADLERSIEVNSFFNVFDYIPVLQSLPPSDPLFQQGFALFRSYLENPDTLQCVTTQPEICANAGLAPRNIQGALTLFGDLYAKAGDLDAGAELVQPGGRLPGHADVEIRLRSSRTARRMPPRGSRSTPTPIRATIRRSSAPAPRRAPSVTIASAKREPSKREA